MITTATNYDYPMSGRYAETVATLADGRICTIDTQYSCVLPQGDHADGCEQFAKMGGRCTCGLLDGIDIVALVADARINGKRGAAPVPPETAEHKAERLAGLVEYEQHGTGWCNKCHSYCYGDCQAN